LPAAPLAESLVSFSYRRHARGAARCIARFFLSTMPRSPRRSLHRSFLSLADVLTTAPLAASFVSFSGRRLARRTARCRACFFLLLTSCPPRRSLHRSFLSPSDVLPAAPLAESLVSFSGRRLARRAARSLRRSFLLTSCPPRRSLHRSFLSLVDVLPAAPLAASLVSLTGQPLARVAAHDIARFFGSLPSYPPCRSLYRLFLSLVAMSRGRQKGMSNRPTGAVGGEVW
jgi:hypothetical protein